MSFNENLDSWRGRKTVQTDIVHAVQLDGLAALLDRPGEGGTKGGLLEPLWHWTLFQPRALQRDIGPDGHPKRGDFLPPVTLPRRMWAAGRIMYVDEVKLGDRLERTSTVAQVRSKRGRSGPLVFVSLVHEISGRNGTAILEEQEIVYREAAQPGAELHAGEVAAYDEEFSRRMRADPTLLFRYSALTFNSHRIHYDRDYAKHEEGYPGLVVHGPLLATLLADLVRQNCPRESITNFRFKAIRPVFDIHPFTLCGRRDAAGLSLWVRDHEGFLAMQAHAEVG